VPLEGRAAGALAEAAAEGDLGMVLDNEEVGAAPIRVAGGLAGPYTGRFGLALELASRQRQSTSSRPWMSLKGRAPKVTVM
jgi:hypothetical protein